MHKNLYMAIILGTNMLYINFCLFKETPMARKGLINMSDYVHRIYNIDLGFRVLNMSIASQV